MIFTLLAHPLVPWIISAIIIATAVLLWFNFSHHIRILIDAVQAATSQIEAADGQINFKKRFAAIFKSVSDNPVLGGVWRAYAATIEVSPGDDTILGYSRRPRESFNEGIATANGLNLRFYQAVPNLLVGAGLLFTFLGLVGALHFASAGVAAADIEQAQSALGALLATATFKFMTSIAGLASSIIFSWREKAKLAHLEQAISRFCDALEARMVPITTENLLAVTVKELRLQSKELTRLGRQSVVMVPEELDAQIRQSVQRSVDRLGPVIDAAGKQLAILDKVIADEVEASLSHRRNIETLPELENEVAAIQSDIKRLDMRAETGSSSSERPVASTAREPDGAPSSSQSTGKSKSTGKSARWLRRWVGGGVSGKVVGDSAISRKLGR